MDEKIIQEITDTAGSGNVFRNEPMSLHVTMKVGGPSEMFVTPSSEEVLSKLLKIISENGLPYYVIGNGSNVIVKDEGYSGIIICFGRNFSKIEVSENTITAQAGALLKDISAAAYENSLTGFEFACGIPGSAGGSAGMNAGAYGGEMKDVIRQVRALTPEGDVRIISNEQMDFGYRHSICSEESLIITQVVYELKKGDRALIKAAVDDLTAKRNEKQPLEYPSSGSTFKRPEGYFAGKLIMDSGLKGYSVGGAQVSEKHCGFVINKNNAKAADVLALIEYIKETVYEKQGVRLECEVKIL